jgi:hypothetical protein
MNQNPSDDEKAKRELIALLKEKSAILMVGAGSSSKVGYPRWNELLRNLRDKFNPDLNDPDSNSDLLEYAQKIKKRAIDDKKEREYYKYLYQTFKPSQYPENYTQFHKSLVGLGFCGIVTTNYDKIIETAVQAVFSTPDRIHDCNPLDLCEDKTYSIFPFLRQLNPNNHHLYVLHLHGFYSNPKTIILTKDDYLTRYGLLDEKNESKPVSKPLDKIHRKVIWALLTLHPLLFVGFSLNDPFFLDLIKTVQTDFELENSLVHYATMGYSSEYEKLKISNNLKGLGVSPIFYRIPDGTHNHEGLDDLIFELENELISRINPQEKEPVQEEKTGDGNTLNDTPMNFPSPDQINQITGGP